MGRLRRARARPPEIQNLQAVALKPASRKPPQAAKPEPRLQRQGVGKDQAEDSLHGASFGHSGGRQGTDGGKDNGGIRTKTGGRTNSARRAPMPHHDGKIDRTQRSGASEGRIAAQAGRLPSPPCRRRRQGERLSRPAGNAPRVCGGRARSAAIPTRPGGARHEHCCNRTLLMAGFAGPDCTGMLLHSIAAFGKPA